MAVSNYSVPQRWSVAEPTFAAEELARALKLPPLVGRCLVNRRIIAHQLAEEFLDPRLKRLSDPFLLPNMKSAVDRLDAAIERKEGILVYGDYDVDGTTAAGWAAKNGQSNIVITLRAAEKAAAH